MALTNLAGYGLNSSEVAAIRDVVAAIGAAGGAAAFLELTDAASANLPQLNSPLNAALAEKADGGSLVTYAGTGRDFTDNDNGDIILCTNVGAVTMHLPDGLASGFNCIVVQKGGVVTITGSSVVGNPEVFTNGVNSAVGIIPAGTNSYVVFSPTGAGAVAYGDLTDATTVDLPTDNAPLATILASLQSQIDAITSGGTEALNILAADVVNSTTSLADVTGLSFPVTANKTYKFRFVIPYSSAATTTGSVWSINGPGTPSKLNFMVRNTLTGTSDSVAFSNAYNSPSAANASSLAAGNLAIIEGFIKTDTTGNVIARFASEVGASAITALAGATVSYVQVLDVPAPPAGPVLVQAKEFFNTGTSVSGSLAAPVTSGNLVVIKTWYADNSVASLSIADDQSNSYGSPDVNTVGVQDPGARMEIWHKVNVTNGPQTFTCTSGTFRDHVMWVEEWSGMNASPFGQVIHTNASDTNPTTGSFTTGTDHEIFTGMVINSNGTLQTLTATSPAILDPTQVEPTVVHAFLNADLGTAGSGKSVAGTFGASQPWDVVGITLKAA